MADKTGNSGAFAAFEIFCLDHKLYRQMVEGRYSLREIAVERSNIRQEETARVRAIFDGVRADLRKQALENSSVLHILLQAFEQSTS